MVVVETEIFAPLAALANLVTVVMWDTTYMLFIMLVISLVYGHRSPGKIQCTCVLLSCFQTFILFLSASSRLSALSISLYQRDTWICWLYGWLLVHYVGVAFIRQYCSLHRRSHVKC